MNSRISSYCTKTHLHHGLWTSAILWQYLNSHQRHPGYTRRNSKVMPSITYGMTLTFGDYVMIKSYAGASRTSRSSRSSNFSMQHLEVAIMDQLGQPEKCLIMSSIGPPFSEMPINSSPPVNSAKKAIPISNGYFYILLVMDYVEAIATKTNDAKVVVDFLKSNIFCRFGVLKALMSEHGSHFCNRAMSSLLHKYGVVHKVATAYHP
ncbi:hypothetical protein CR513_31571, partial [Mucuna pruriens]